MNSMTASAADLVTRFEQERKDRLWRQRSAALLGLILFSGLLWISLHRSGFFDMSTGARPLQRIAELLHRLMPHLEPGKLMDDRQTRGSLAWWLYDLPAWLKAAWQTLEMAILATVFGAMLAAVAGCLTARNLMPISGIRFVVRRLLEMIRTLPDLIMALILVAAFGVGPFAGVLTLAISTAGGLGKLFSEINEQIDHRPLEAIEASGAGRIRQIRYGVLPQVLPAYASYTLIRLEGNLAGAAALGIVGAGGIGLELQKAITYAEYDTYLAILMMIISMIFVIDLVSEQIRHHLIGIGGH